MLNPKTEIREYLEKLVRQYIMITGMNNQLKIMREWESPNRIEALNEGAYFFRLVSFSFTRTLLIEIAKFISEKENKSLIDFLITAKKNSKCLFPKKNNPDSKNRDPITEKEFVEIIDNQLEEIEKHCEIISNINSRRDKAFAHTDKQYFNNQSKFYAQFPIKLADIENLMNTISEILRTQHSYLLNSDIDLEVKSTGNVDRILINNRAFNRVSRDKNLIKLGIKPFEYGLDDYSNDNEF